MANRNDSDARQHETLPGPGPGSSAPAGGGGRPVEQMVDAAIERIAVERTVRDRGGSVELARRSAAEASLARRDAAAQALRVPTRLRWKGLDVSDEFRQYAERIARGEELPPFEGRVLAEPHPAFPWGGDGAVAEAEPKARGAHPAVWAAAIVVLGLLGWSVALKLEGAEPNASLDTAVAPLAATPAEHEAKLSVTPPDVVETPAPAAPATEPASAQPEPAEPATVTASSVAPSSVSSAPPSPAVPAAAVPALATAAPGLDMKVAPPSPAPAAGASVAVDLARPGALQQAVGAALAGQSGAGGPAPAASTSVRDDDFGIMASVSPAPGAAPPAATSGAVTAAPAGAKSNGSVGDLSRAGQPAGSGVRKEPGSESSAKGSLLVETPSF